MALIRPFIYTVCDREYHSRYAIAFLNSARHHGHQAEVYCKEDFVVRSKDDMAFFVFWRYELLPDLIRKHSNVLLVDIDSVFLGPAEVDSSYDLGLFLRNTHRGEEKNSTKVLGGVFYCSLGGIKFAESLAKNMAASEKLWYKDQEVLWNTYCDIGGDFLIKRFDDQFVDWKFPTRAPIYTAKGNRKTDSSFLSKKKEWEFR